MLFGTQDRVHGKHRLLVMMYGYSASFHMHVKLGTWIFFLCSHRADENPARISLLSSLQSSVYLVRVLQRVLWLKVHLTPYLHFKTLEILRNSSSHFPFPWMKAYADKCPHLLQQELLKAHPIGHIPASLHNHWVAVKELNLGYYFGETQLFAIYAHHGNTTLLFWGNPIICHICPLW